MTQSANPNELEGKIKMLTFGFETETGTLCRRHLVGMLLYFSINLSSNLVDHKNGFKIEPYPCFLLGKLEKFCLICRGEQKQFISSF